MSILSASASPKVAFPSTVISLFIDVVPVVAPNSSVVAAPPIFNEVALALKILAVASVVVISPPFTAKFPGIVTSSPEKVEFSTSTLPLSEVRVKLPVPVC